MGGNRIILVLVLAAVFVVGCGGGGDGSEVEAEKAEDTAYLNSALAQELTSLELYTEALPRLRGRAAAVGRRLRSQEQEYISAITKAIRGLGAETEAEATDPDLSGARSQADLLTLAYELESAALAANVEAAPRLHTSAPRTLATALAAGHAQHLVVLRQSFGSALVDSIPTGFDVGETPPPGAEPSPGEG